MTKIANGEIDVLIYIQLTIINLIYRTIVIAMNPNLKFETLI